jgi:hypothetical protein
MCIACKAIVVLFWKDADNTARLCDDWSRRLSDRIDAGFKAKL